MASSDVQILVAGAASVPVSYQVPNAQELEPLAVAADFDGSGAAGSFLPTLVIQSDAGLVVARVPVDSAVAAGGSASVTWAPFLRRRSSGGSSSPVWQPFASLGYMQSTLQEWSGLNLSTAFIDSTSNHVAALTPLTYTIAAGTTVTGCVIDFANGATTLAGGAFQVGLVDTAYTVLTVSADAKAALAPVGSPVTVRTRIPFPAPYTFADDTDAYFLLYKSTVASNGTVPILGVVADGPSLGHGGGFPYANIALTDATGTNILPATLPAGFSFAAALANANVSKSNAHAYFGGIY